MKIKFQYIFIIVIFNICLPQKLLIPMDHIQTDHLKAYGIAFLNLKKSIDVEWLLNYRGGSFLFDDNADIKTLCTVRGVAFELVDATKLSEILTDIEANNMDIVLLEKKPKIAVYSPPDKLPWDDAVTLALAYAEIDYDVIFDDEVINGKINDYDWLHLHHEDFTGQYGKFYRSYRNAPWYLKMEKDFNHKR